MYIKNLIQIDSLSITFMENVNKKKTMSSNTNKVRIL